MLLEGCPPPGDALRRAPQLMVPSPRGGAVRAVKRPGVCSGVHPLMVMLPESS